MLPKLVRNTFLILFIICQPTLAQTYSRDYIRMAGSSTVYPFARTIAEEFSRNNPFKTPIIEATGTGGGIKLFCLGVGKKYIDFANASRRMEPSELEECHKNGIRNIIEIKIGYDGIVLANSIKSTHYSLTKEQIFLALAEKIPLHGKLVKNPYQKWSDIDKSLPDQEIMIYGKPPTSGTRDAFSELVMEGPCIKKPEFIALYPDINERKRSCHIIRNDGRFIEAGENDNLVVQKLKNNSDALGIFGFSFLEQNGNIIQGTEIDGFYPTFENIAKNKYKVSRPLFIYFKKEHLSLAPGIKDFIKEIINVDAIGEDGYLIEKGLIPMSRLEMKKMREEILGGLY